MLIVQSQQPRHRRAIHSTKIINTAYEDKMTNLYCIEHLIITFDWNSNTPQQCKHTCWSCRANTTRFHCSAFGQDMSLRLTPHTPSNSTFNFNHIATCIQTYVLFVHGRHNTVPFESTQSRHRHRGIFWQHMKAALRHHTAWFWLQNQTRSNANARPVRPCPTRRHCIKIDAGSSLPLHYA